MENQTWVQETLFVLQRPIRRDMPRERSGRLTSFSSHGHNPKPNTAEKSLLIQSKGCPVTAQERSRVMHHH